MCSWIIQERLFFWVGTFDFLLDIVILKLDLENWVAKVSLVFPALTRNQPEYSDTTAEHFDVGDFASLTLSKSKATREIL